MSDPFEENPFADPSVQKASGSVQATQQQSLDDYNPFAKQNVQTKPAAIIPTNTRHPEYTPLDAAPPTYTNSSSQRLDLNQIERQQEELDRRAAELDRREQNISSPTATTGGEKNFPPTPMWFPKPLRPCFYQDINREIPVEFQKWVRALFYLWSFHSLVLAFNIIAALVVWTSTDKGGTTFGFAILYFILFTPLSYVCWFRPAYKGFRTDSSINFMIFFFIFFIQIIVNCLEAVGFIDSGYCGIILLVTLFSGVNAQTAFAAVMVLITSIGFITVAAADILILMKIHGLYRSTGASFEKAQKEFATGVMANKNVQNAATTVITESARATMNGQASNYGGAGGAGGKF